MNEYNLNKPKFYLRYADDILAAFDNERDLLTLSAPIPDEGKKISLTLIFTLLWGALKGFMKAFKAFNSFKFTNYFPYKDSILDDLESFLVYKFTCASFSSSSIGETCRHFKTGTEEYIKKDGRSHISEHLHSTATCLDLDNSLSFKVIDKAISKFDLKNTISLQKIFFSRLIKSRKLMEASLGTCQTSDGTIRQKWLTTRNH